MKNRIAHLNDLEIPAPGLPETDRQDEPMEPSQMTGNNARASWNFSADTLMANTAHYSAEARELLRWCFGYCITPRYSIRREEFARRVGYSDNVIFKIFAGSYKHPQTGELLDVPAKLLRAMRQFRKVETERAMLGDTEFVETPTVHAIWDHADTARELQQPLMLVGGSQIGKTEALTQYALRNNHGGTPYVRLAASGGMHAMVRAIAAAVGVSPKSEAKSLVERIKRALSPNTLLIIDEVHLLSYTYRKESFFSCLEVIREIYDATNCGMILCMTELGYHKIEAERVNALEQLCKRGPVRLHLGPVPTMADVRAIIKSKGLTWPTATMTVETAGVVEHPFAMLRQLAKQDGLKSITTRLRMATKLAQREGAGKLTWEHVVEAHYTILARAVPPQAW